MAGLYVHFPFCASRCIYCDFYSRTGCGTGPFAESLCRESDERRDFLKGVPPTTVYFGGGTPSFVPSAILERVAAHLQSVFGTAEPEEFTIEVNPDDITPAKAGVLKGIGATRISMGVQSFCDSHLEWMRRRHTAAGAVKAFGTLRDAGFGNISLDLIFGFTGLADQDWEKSIGQAVSLRPEHISCYQMMGRYAEPDEETCRRQYTMLQKRLEEAGYLQYEVSNYALPGCESRHNSAYWSRKPYLGLGPGAHSFDGDRQRCWNTPDLEAYVKDRPHGGERLSDREVYEEKLMLSLRTVRGLRLGSLNPVERGYLEKKKTALEGLSRAGRLIVTSDSVRIPKGELFVSDWIIGQLFPTSPDKG